MNTLENNKLIAEFMNLPTERFNSGILNYGFDEAWYELEELSYHESWDWLMPVVEGCLKEIPSTMKEELFTSDIHDALWTINIDEVYKSVVTFIKWYNENNL